ncbi:MAG: AraC family transcriptional regulator [Acidobacteriota bacterium]
MIQPGEERVLESGHYMGRAVSRYRAPGLYLNLSSYRQGQSLSRHSHRNAHFCMVMNGAYTERIDGHSLDRGPADLMFYPPGVSHSETHRTRGGHFLIEIDPDVFKKFRDVGACIDRLMSLAAGPPRWTAIRLYREFRAPDRFSALSMEGLVLELLAETLRVSTCRTERPEPPWLDRAEEILRTRFVEPPGLAAIAAELGIHPVHLARRFRRRFGCTAGEYVRRLRLELAERELIGSDRSVGAVAHDAGFFDQSHFARLFKRKTGMAPGRYRKLFRNGSFRPNG